MDLNYAVAEPAARHLTIHLHLYPTGFPVRGLLIMRK